VITIALALQLLAASSAPGLPNFVQVVGINGLPTDSLPRGAFLAGFRGEFAADVLPAEQKNGAGDWDRSAPVSNRFKWLEGDGGGYGGEEAWKLTVTLGSPSAVVLPKRAGEKGRRVLETQRRSRGMIAAFTLQAPTPGRERETPVVDREAFTFPGSDAPSDPDATEGVPAIGYKFDWNEAGRIVARLALEQLHRRSREIDDGVRVSIAPAIRVESGR
jgi:hypothetical protein